jgi:hypothetical protein
MKKKHLELQTISKSMLMKAILRKVSCFLTTPYNTPAN